MREKGPAEVERRSSRGRDTVEQRSREVDQGSSRGPGSDEGPGGRGEVDSESSRGKVDQVEE